MGSKGKLKSTNFGEIMKRYDADPFSFLLKAESLYGCYETLLSTKPSIPSDLVGSIAISQKSFKYVALGLLGFAFENLFKSKIGIKYGVVDDKGNLNDQITGHILTSKAKAAYPDLVSAENMEEFKKLQAFSIWCGRYSHPLKGKDYELLSPDSIDLDSLERIFIKIRNLLRKELRPEYYQKI